MARQSSHTAYSHKKKSRSFRGVRFRKGGTWAAEIRVPNSRNKIWLGAFSSVEQAARAYDAATYCLRGSNSHFNFPDSPPKRIDPDVINSASAIRTVSRDYALQFDSVSHAQQQTGPAKPVMAHHVISDNEYRAVAAENRFAPDYDDRLPDERVLDSLFDEIFITREFNHHFTLDQQEVPEELDDIAGVQNLWESP